MSVKLTNYYIHYLMDIELNGLVSSVASLAKILLNSVDLQDRILRKMMVDHLFKNAEDFYKPFVKFKYNQPLSSTESGIILNLSSQKETVMAIAASLATFLLSIQRNP